jgi:hypothetical protein
MDFRVLYPKKQTKKRRCTLRRLGGVNTVTVIDTQKDTKNKLGRKTTPYSASTSEAKAHQGDQQQGGSVMAPTKQGLPPDLRRCAG